LNVGSRSVTKSSTPRRAREPASPRYRV
jgi:hypothetical protein